MIINKQGALAGTVQTGLRLAALPEAEGGWAEYFMESEEADLRIKDDLLRAGCALMLENAKQQLVLNQGLPSRMNEDGNLVINEATRSALVGGFSDFLFPTVRASFPTNPINELVSVQPTNRRTAQIVYWSWIVGTQKGSFTPGQKLFDANTGKQTRDINFSNEVVPAEPIPALGGAGATLAGTLGFTDGGGVRPATVQLTADLVTLGADGIFVDNGNGGWISSVGGVTVAGTIDYRTGAYSLTLTGDTFSTAATNTVTYRWDSEGSQSIPQVDIDITTNTVETERRALKINYSREAVQDVMSEFGVSLEPNLVEGAAEQINYEIARQIISEIWKQAPVAANFNLTVPSGISQQEHFRDIIYQLTIASNSLWARTQKAQGNWMVVDQQFAALVQSLPASLFQAATPSNIHGLHYIGTLMGQFRVYRDLHLDKEPGAAPRGNALMGYKGRDFFDAGFVYAPYQLMYTTGPLETADFLTQRGIATRYATKMVNPDMYARIILTQV